MSFYNETYSGNHLDHDVSAIGTLRRSLCTWIALRQLKYTLRQERKHLASFSSSELEDIGLTRGLGD